MTKAELIEALAGLGIQASGKSTVAQLQAQLDEAKAAAVVAPPPGPPADTTTEGGADQADPPGAGDDQATKDEPANDPPPSDPPAAPSATVLVKVGPNGQAGRIIVGGVAIDGRIPGRISRNDYEVLRVTYDLREVDG